MSSTRPIDADKLHYKRVWIYDIQGGELRGTKSAVVVFADEIDKNKKARLTDVAPVVHGHYVGEYDGYADGNPVYDMWYCSECGYYFEDWDDKPTYNFCPFCGVKMDGGDSDD